MAWCCQEAVITWCYMASIGHYEWNVGNSSDIDKRLPGLTADIWARGAIQEACGENSPCYIYSIIRLNCTSHFIQWRTQYFGQFCWNICMKSTWLLFQLNFGSLPLLHDDVIKWKHFPYYWPFMWGIHRSPVNSPHKGQWCGALMFCSIRAWTNGWVNIQDASDLRCLHAHYEVIVINRDLVIFSQILTIDNMGCLVPVQLLIVLSQLL